MADFRKLFFALIAAALLFTAVSSAAYDMVNNVNFATTIINASTPSGTTNTYAMNVKGYIARNPVAEHRVAVVNVSSTNADTDQIASMANLTSQNTANGAACTTALWRAGAAELAEAAIHNRTA